MKGDFSRLTFDDKKHYSAVLKQQGRVDVDADWNEQQAINGHRIKTEARDVIGCCGAPQRAPGFHVVTKPEELRPEESGLPGNSGITATQGTDFFISAGRIYVDGILCENERAVAFSQQPDLPPLADSSSGTINAGTKAIVYLDVWRRHITALDDPAIREKALGGPDTATRLKTIWQVKILAVNVPRFNAREFSEDIVALGAAFKAIGEKLQPQMRRQLAGIKKSARKLVASRAAVLEWLPTVEEARKLLDDVARLKVPRAVSSVVSEIVDPIRARLPSEELVSCKSQFPEWDRLIAPPTGQLRARTNPAPPSDDPCCTIPPGAGYRGLENQLYRVEIHQGNIRPDGELVQDAEPSFKWSRDNGSVVTAITGIDKKATSSTISVHDVGPDNALGFSVGQWVEVTDDTRELNGRPGDLVQITDIPPNSRQIVVKGTVTVDFKDGVYHPKLRRWDSPGAITIEVPTTNDDWISLEAGIDVNFPVKDGTYKTGDYWLIPARTANSETSNDIEWPRDANSLPIPQPPRGIRHHYCRLALVALTQGIPDGGVAGPIGIADIQDCRCIFPPLCKLKPSATPEAGIRIESVSLKEGHFLSEPAPAPVSAKMTEFVKGIQIVCSSGVKISQNNSFLGQFVPQPACFVTLQLPYTLGGQGNLMVLSSSQNETMGYQPFILDAEVSIDGNKITWKPAKTEELTLAFLEAVFRPLQSSPILASLTLNGNYIWGSLENGSPTYLDGESFGDPTETEATRIIFLSGDGRRGGAFEMWFWLIQR